ncbi:MAG: pyridoxal phosphate-dependent aminotransferase family protein [Paludibacteraceae bacterium]|nr:pyridoxal phosphate-dependent aminotransferase family protein [Paludibacteraceae bacterium]NLK91998.1 pyridoxal phosphate-dependent aminotransferase family protein [Bacteroidales bacterium]MBP7219433.1 pyridoxal phosphate-dependent aminotransferase family protein [Paludibacteraceae bacterium]MBP8627758.1 pyridoxal phosphate-dependent aminotransferase family protein [Paludibacteraceae bacterium]MBP8781676.1 pyridoxal phosphate-dependent aminotransferase family protein [Paludibacteraceae bacte
MSLLSQKLAKYDAPQKIQEAGVYPYFRPISSDQDTVVQINGKPVLMFGSNSYLGLTNHPEIKQAAIKAVEKYGTGCAGSRFLNGTLDIHLELEARLAKLVGKEEALVYATGFTVNSGVVSCLTGKEDYVILDKANHASIIEGSRLSFSKIIKYAHNDMDALEKQLKKCEPDKVKLIVVDGVFSMEGDEAKLLEIADLAKKYNASIMVDEAHSLGVYGNHGAGICNHLGVTKDVDLIMGTFSKSLATIGGFIAADKHIINYLKHTSRTLIFSASITPASTACVLAALDVMEKETWRMDALWANTNYMRAKLQKAGFDTGHSTTPIIPLYVRDNTKTFMLTRMLMEDGVFVNPVVSPAVASEDTLIRISLMATHTFDQIDEAVEKITKNATLLAIL